jgi:hypothetical protein
MPASIEKYTYISQGTTSSYLKSPAPLRLYVRCSSTAPIVPVLEHQSEALQADFRQRIIQCRDCGWCKNSKVLGPSEYTYKREQPKICWYSFPENFDLGPPTVSLIKEYALMHEVLPKLK